MHTIMRAAAFAAVCLLPGLISAGDAFAQSGRGGQAAAVSPSLTLLSTKLASKSDTILLSTSPTLAFDPLTIDCPGGESSCTLRIEVSAVLAKLNTGAQMQFLVDGNKAGIVPSSTIAVRASTDNGVFTETFTVWRPNLTPGTHVVKVRLPLAPLFAGNEQGVVTMRTLTAQMLAP